MSRKKCRRFSPVNLLLLDGDVLLSLDDLDLHLLLLDPGLDLGRLQAVSHLSLSLRRVHLNQSQQCANPLDRVGQTEDDQER